MAWHEGRCEGCDGFIDLAKCELLGRGSSWYTTLTRHCLE